MTESKLRQFLIHGVYRNALRNERYDQRSILLITSRGVIKGNLVDVKMSTKNDDVFLRAVKKIAGHYYKSQGKDFPDKSESYILLANVVLLDESSDILLKHLLVFTDEVLGIAIDGNSEDDMFLYEDDDLDEDDEF